MYFATYETSYSHILAIYKFLRDSRCKLPNHCFGVFLVLVESITTPQEFAMNTLRNKAFDL